MKTPIEQCAEEIRKSCEFFMLYPHSAKRSLEEILTKHFPQPPITSSKSLEEIVEHYSSGIDCGEFSNKVLIKQACLEYAASREIKERVPAKEAAKPTGRQYESVEALCTGEGLPQPKPVESLDATPRTNELRESLMTLVKRTSVTYHVEQWLNHSIKLERENNALVADVEKLKRHWIEDDRDLNTLISERDALKLAGGELAERLKITSKYNELMCGTFELNNAAVINWQSLNTTKKENEG